MQGHDLPLVVVDGRTGRPGVRVRLIVEELVPGLGDLEHEVFSADFAMSYITRSGRVDIDRLRKLSPRFVERYERERS